jgi:hypothetical protein
VFFNAFSKMITDKHSPMRNSLIFITVVNIFITSFTDTQFAANSGQICRYQFGKVSRTGTHESDL